MPLRPSVKIDTSQWKKNLKEYQKNFPGRVMAALYQETAVELREVIKRTPVQWGDLRRSEHILGPFRQDRRVWCEIVCGGPSAPYAVYVHENLDAFHKVGQAKFMESVIYESRPYMAARVAARLQATHASGSAAPITTADDNGAFHNDDGEFA